MAKIPVSQADGEITITPGGIESQRTYQVVAGSIDVDDNDVTLVMQALGLGAPVALTKEELAAVEQAAYDRSVAAANAAQATLDNAKAVADANVAGIARAAAASKKKPAAAAPA